MKQLRELPLGLYEKAVCLSMPWEEKLTLARESGFDYFEMSVDATPERVCRLTSSQIIREVRRAVSESGCPIYTMALTVNRVYPLGSQDSAVREMGFSLVRQGIDFAAQIGIQVVHLAAYDEHPPRDNEDTKHLFEEAICQCAYYAQKTGVVLALETMETPYMGSCQRIMRLVRQIDLPNFQCYADIGNLTSVGVDPSADLPLAKGHIAGIHLKDARPGVCRDVPFGEGIVDFDAALKTLHGMGYQGFFAAETWCYDKPEFHAGLPRINRFLRQKMSTL